MGIFFSEFVLLFNTNPALIAFIWTIISFGDLPPRLDTTLS
ncbi:Uncharacterised protein [Citrobacter freundii]|nr:Uncharacterised protein [Citrobacter freundii]